MKILLEMKIEKGEMIWAAPVIWKLKEISNQPTKKESANVIAERPENFVSSKNKIWISWGQKKIRNDREIVKKYRNTKSKKLEMIGK